MRELILKVVEWGCRIGLLMEGTPMKQVRKVREEAGELMHAVIDHDNTLREHGLGDLTHIKMETGDVLVTLILLSEMYGIDLNECLRMAYNKINKRVDTGKMIDGVFVKEEDLK